MAFNQLEKKDYMKISLRAYSLQNGLNYDSYQDFGYANVLYPALRKTCKDDGDEFQEVLKEDTGSFDIDIHFLPFIVNLHLVMLENKTLSNEIRNIKMALVGPLAGIGDSPAQFCLASLFATIGTPLARDGLIIGSILFFMVVNMIPLVIELPADMWRCKLGTDIVVIPSTKMEQIPSIASMIGVTAISGLTVNFVRISTPTQYVANMSGGRQKVVVIQEMIDVIAPKLLLVLFAGFISYLVKAKKWTIYKLVILTIILGVALSVLCPIA